MTTDEFFARIQAHLNNIRRYRRLLNTNLTEEERQFIFKRLSEEEAALGLAALPQNYMDNPSQGSARRNEQNLPSPSAPTI